MTNRNGWTQEPLGCIAHLTMGQSPESRYYTEEEIGLPFLQGCAEFGDRYPKAVLHCSEIKKLAKRGSILFSVRAPVGRTNIADQDYVIGRGLAGIGATNVDQSYLAHYLRFSEEKFRNASQGSTFESINSAELSNWPIIFPTDAREQTHIAAILSTIDKAIAQTEAIIAKQQRIKTALMQDLLTRGIDEHGNIRSEETHAFKDSPLGRIPVEWAVGGILDFASRTRQSILTGPFGADLGANDFVDEGKPVLRIGNVQAGFFDLSDLLYVSEKKASELERYKVESGDLLFARQGATTGRNALADKTVDGFLINYHIIRVAVDPERCVPEFLFAAFNSHVVQNQVDREKGRGTREGVSGEALKCFRLPIPPHAEQERISFVLTQHAAASHAQIETLRKFIKQKTALMQDLLTGKVRVTPLLEATGA